MNEKAIIIGWIFLVYSWTMPFLVSDKRDRARVGMVLSATALIVFLIGYLIH